MKEVKFNKANNENPFKGMSNCLKLFNGDISTVDAAYKEANTFEKKAMFYSLLFSIGDITNREHNLFHHHKVDGGGRSERSMFFAIMEWMKSKHYDQFVKFMNAGLFNEYTCMDNLYRSRIQTYPGKNGTIKSEICVFENKKYCKDLLKYTLNIIKGNNPFNKFLVAKFLTLPRTSKRSKHKAIRPETLRIMKLKADFLKSLSEKMGWPYIYTGNYTNFVGYRKWRQQYNQELESVLFASGKINEFSKLDFLSWIEKLPSNARFRVRNRVCFPVEINGETKLKYPKIKTWFDEWEKVKEAKQAEERILKEKCRQGTATEEDKVKLKEVSKQAKVNIGATNFKELYADILSHNVDELKLEKFVEKVKLEYNNLIIVDDSGSMSGGPFNVAKFLASIFLVKNPDDDGRSLIGMFNDKSRLYSCIDRELKPGSHNSFWGRAETIKVKNRPFVDPTKSFYDNYLSISNFMDAEFNGGCTYIDSIPQGFAYMAKKDPTVLDALKNYPIWTIISDGEWNNMYNPEKSLREFFDNCEKLLGFKPFVLAIDVNGFNGIRSNINQFAGIENFMYIPGDPAQIEQMLVNFKDIDIMDVYSSLLSIYRSNRYEPVRANVL